MHSLGPLTDHSLDTNTIHCTIVIRLERERERERERENINHTMHAQQIQNLIEIISDFTAESEGLAHSRDH